MTSSGEYSEVSQLMTRCAVLESQVKTLESQNAQLKELVTKLYPKETHSTDQKLADWKKSTSGMFPPGQAGILGDGDGSFQL